MLFLNFPSFPLTKFDIHLDLFSKLTFFFFLHFVFTNCSSNYFLLSSTFMVYLIVQLFSGVALAPHSAQARHNLGGKENIPVFLNW